MRPISFRAVLIVAAIGFFVLGLASTILGSRADSPRAGATPTERSAQPSSVAAPQVSVLILGVDSLDDETPGVLAAWLASFRPPGREVFLFGFPIDHRIDDELTLAQAVAASGGDFGSLRTALGGLTPLPIDAVVVLDTAGFATLIDFVGGLPTGETIVDGESALSVLDLLRDDPAASVLAQSRLVQALTAQAATVRSGTDLQPLIDLIPEHAYLSLSPEQVVAMVAPYLPLEVERVHISLPSPLPDGGEG